MKNFLFLLMVTLSLSCTTLALADYPDSDTVDRDETPSLPPAPTYESGPNPGDTGGYGEDDTE